MVAVQVKILKTLDGASAPFISYSHLVTVLAAAAAAEGHTEAGEGAPGRTRCCAVLHPPARRHLAGLLPRGRPRCLGVCPGPASTQCARCLDRIRRHHCSPGSARAAAPRAVGGSAWRPPLCPPAGRHHQLPGRRLDPACRHPLSRTDQPVAVRGGAAHRSRPGRHVPPAGAHGHHHRDARPGRRGALLARTSSWRRQRHD